MGYSETDSLLIRKDGTIKLATIGVTAEKFDLAVAHITHPKESIIERGIQFIGKIGLGKTALVTSKASPTILLVDSVTCAPARQTIIVQTSLENIKSVVEKKQTDQLLLECAQEYLEIMKRKNSDLVPMKIHARGEYDEPTIIDGGASCISKHRNNKWQNPYKKKGKRKEKKKSRRANRK